MLKIKVYMDNKIKEIVTEKGLILLDVLKSNDIFLPASCGGHGICNDCKVQIIEGKVLGEETNGWVKSCQSTVIEDISIEIASQNAKILSGSENQNYEIEKQDGYGIAVDIGTTTIVCYLVSLQTGEEVDVTNALNKQASYGSDVLSRINSATNGYLEDLKNIIITQIAEMIKQLCDKNSIHSIKKVIIAGNTTMLHLFAGVDPTTMGQAPFLPIFTNTRYMEKKELGENLGEVVLLPSATAFIGSDIICGLATRDIARKDISLFIDIGTNGEIVLNGFGKLTACATAAGPAFEGGNIEKGMGGVSGAIDHIKYENGKLNFTTIDGKPALGICGSGLIDIVSVLLEQGLVDPTGAFVQDCYASLSEHMYKEKFYITKDVYITQKDIREFQFAKSAIFSGIATLLKEKNFLFEEVDKIYLAGGFGYYLDKNSAIKTGLLPSEFQGKIISVGNTSGLGAKMCLLNRKYITVCEDISTQIKVVELSNNKHFIDFYIFNMSFNN